ncbi:MAG TPA: ATP-binding protein [Haliangiales bacterium]|nr:ATP-binding protein [Haliangiales bacterium]
MIKRTRLVFGFGLLLTVWVMVAAWQVVEHVRVKESARAALINRSRDITTTLGLVIRSQRRFGGMVSQERLEPALGELVKSGELSSVALLNAAGEVVASAGAPIDVETKGTMRTGEHWDSRSVTLVNLVDLGASVAQEGETNRPTIVLPRREPGSGPREGDRPRPSGEMPPPPDGELRTNGPLASNAPTSLSNAVARMPASVSNDPGTTNRADGGPRERPPGRPRFGRPPWVSEEEFKSLVEKRGLHGLVIVMSTEAFLSACAQDLWLRCIIGCFASVAVVGLGLAWRNQAKSAELQMRLLRASELNTHLKEMNLAAAGLAHETRNPLNIIRGLAQMISKQKEAPTEVRSRSREIIDETDRVTAQLNEFINYSRPREVRRSSVSLSLVVGEVVRALGYDLEEKCIRLQVPESLPVIEGDEQLLRQALFNLLINAVQAVERGGDIEVAAWKNNSHGVILEIRDNGPGVPPEHRIEIFKPYFTTHQKGTGLGLAVVQQIVLAHGWEIECLPNEPRGAVLRITHLKLASGG